MFSFSPLFDETTKQCLEIIFGSLCFITKTMLHDHLKGGIYDNADENLRQKKLGVLVTQIA